MRVSEERGLPISVSRSGTYTYTILTHPPTNPPHTHTPTHRLLTAFHTAAGNGDTTQLKTLLSSHPLPHLLLNIHDPSKGGTTALHIAARGGVCVSVCVLLELGADVCVVDEGGFTPVDYARVRNRGECLKVLQEHIQKDPPSIKKV